jgi:hypothetical protein
MEQTFYAGPSTSKGLLVFTSQEKSLAELGFLVAVRGPAAKAILRLSTEEPALIGSMPALNHLALADDGVGGCQFSIRYQDGGFHVSNLDPSKQPTVNGEPFERRKLEHHDVIAVGRTELIFCAVPRETLALCTQ